MLSSLLVCVLIHSPGQMATPMPVDVEPGSLRAGLVAEYRSLGKGGETLTRLDAKPAFYLGESSPHPRLPQGPFEVTWNGMLTIKEAGSLTFSAVVGGELSVSIGDTSVLHGRGPNDTTHLIGKETSKLSTGVYPVRIRYRSLEGVPARMQLWWQGTSFAAEPIPAWRFAHLSADNQSLQRELQRERGRQAVNSYGCARCHTAAFPDASTHAPGPSLAKIGERVRQAWLVEWLAKPSPHMPQLFPDDRMGFVARWTIVTHLTANQQPRPEAAKGDHRKGRITFVGVGCTACHLVPDVPLSEQKQLGQKAFTGLADRMNAADIEALLANPHSRYPDGRMPRLPITPNEARDIAAYLLLWSKPTEPHVIAPPSADELQQLAKSLKVENTAQAATKLLRDKGCTSCHTGLSNDPPLAIPIRREATGCATTGRSIRYQLPKETQEAIQAYQAVAVQDRHPSPATERQRQLEHVGCVRCHQRDTDRPAPLEEIGSVLGGAHLQEIPFLKTPKLTYAHQKLTRTHLATSLRDGVTGLRWSRFTYRMPHFGEAGREHLLALSEADGERPQEDDPPVVLPADPTLGTLHGSRLVGFQGYACASCHVWNTRLLATTDPGATGPDLTRTVGRIRREWFDRYLEGPARFHPHTPMPAIFTHKKPASLTNVLDGNTQKQKDALWAYLAQGKNAPNPAPPPALPIAAPEHGLLVAQIPVRVDHTPMESIVVVSTDHDLLIYDLDQARIHRLYVGGQLERNVQGRIRQFIATGKTVELSEVLQMSQVPNNKRTFVSYEPLRDGVRLRWRIQRDQQVQELDETITFDRTTRELVRSMQPDRQTHRQRLPAAVKPPAWNGAPQTPADDPSGSLERIGYRATMYPRPKTISGEDRIMPGAIAVRPRDGLVFVASMKTGELFTTTDASSPRWTNAGGLFQDALSMLADADGVFVLHRRNLSKLDERDGRLTRVERVAGLPHGVADTYDMAYGLARDAKGRFVFGYAPYANTTLAGSGGAIALTPNKGIEEIAYGMRNPLGWCRGPDGEIFYTDNQGEWVASNKLGHVAQGTFQGFPNSGQRQHTQKPVGKPTVWVPYRWARSINGVAYDTTNGKFGPFAGQFFMAELMFGGALIRANVEKVNGVYQGACFPFWGHGLLGPVTLAFDPRGKLYVGSITEPGWMAMPDRGAVYRIDFTGEVPFEIRTITVRPNGFRLTFTKPVDAETALAKSSYAIEHYRYEYTGSYGSPELDRTPVKIEQLTLSADRTTIDVQLPPLVKDRVYIITAQGVRCRLGKPLVNSTGAYTLNEVPRE